MPLTSKGEKIMKAMRGEYGDKQGEKVFYASQNKGTIKGVEKKKHEMAHKFTRQGSQTVTHLGRK